VIGVFAGLFLLVGLSCYQIRQFKQVKAAIAAAS
jgi:hypothetical protein